MDMLELLEEMIELKNELIYLKEYTITDEEEKKELSKCIDKAFDIIDEIRKARETISDLHGGRYIEKGNH